MRIPKGAALIRGRRLFETWRLLEETWYMVGLPLVGSKYDNTQKSNEHKFYFLNEYIPK